MRWLGPDLPEVTGMARIEELREASKHADEERRTGHPSTVPTKPCSESAPAPQSNGGPSRTPTGRLLINKKSGRTAATNLSVNVSKAASAAVDSINDGGNGTEALEAQSKAMRALEQAIASAMSSEDKRRARLIKKAAAKVYKATQKFIIDPTERKRRALERAEGKSGRARKIYGN